MAGRNFRPVGERARWRIIYDLLRKVEVDNVLTYQEMGTALDLHPDRDRTTIQLAMRRAVKELEQADNHTADVIENVGYRVVQPTEHLGLAKRHQRKATKALTRGQSKVVHVDLNGLDDETKRAFEIVAAAFAAQIDFNKRMDVRQRNLERALEAVAVKVEEGKQETETEVSDLRDRLMRLEAKLAKPA